MCPDSDTTRGGNADCGDTRYELKEEPVTEDDEGGNGEEEDDHQGQNAGARIKNYVSAHDAGDGAAGTNCRDR